jgi:hypothetical protein
MVIVSGNGKRGEAKYGYRSPSASRRLRATASWFARIG